MELAIMILEDALKQQKQHLHNAKDFKPRNSKQKLFIEKTMETQRNTIEEIKKAINILKNV